MHVDLDRKSRIPIYLQLKRHLERLILKGAFPAGYKLPASRQLGHELGVNRGTVINAYAELEAEGLVRSHIGQGTFVCHPRGRDGSVPVPLLEEKTQRSKVWRGVFARRVGGMQNREDLAFRSIEIRDGAISFASGTPDRSLFPDQEFGRAVSAALRKYGGDLLEYGPAQGYFPLRQWVSAHLTGFGIAAKPEEVTIVSGSQQALDLVGRLLLDPEDLVILEEPTYFGAIRAFDTYQATYLTVHRSADGIDLRALENILAQHRPKFLYVIPAFHYPTGGCLGRRASRALMEYLEQYQVPFVEDDFCANLRYEGAVQPALKSIDRLGLGIYVGTFSKSLFPGLRIGWVVAPGEVTRQLVAAKQACDLRSGILAQAAAYEFCKRGAYDRHLKKVQEIYRGRRDALLSALERHFPSGCRWEKPQGGFSVWVTLPGEVDTGELLGETAASGVLFAPGSLFSPFGGNGNSMRLGFAPLEPEAIEKGISVIGRAIKRRLRRSRGAGEIESRERLALP